MQTTKVELPDGRLLTIEGGDAAEVGEMLTNHYLAQTPAANFATALPGPGSVPLGGCVPTRTRATNEEAMALPAMNFSNSASAPATECGETALAIPRMF